MFRDMRRKKRQVGEDECKAVLKEGKRAVLSLFGEDGYPYGVPMNYYYAEDENRIYFHGAKEGHKVDAIKACDKACFTVWNDGFKNEGEWYWNITSVIAFGRIRLVDEPELQEERLRALGLKYFPTPEYVEEELRGAGSRAQIFAFDIEHMTGKFIKEK